MLNHSSDCGHLHLVLKIVPCLGPGWSGVPDQLPHDVCPRRQQARRLLPPKEAWSKFRTPDFHAVQASPVAFTLYISRTLDLKTEMELKSRHCSIGSRVSQACDKHLCLAFFLLFFLIVKVHTQTPSHGLYSLMRRAHNFALYPIILILQVQSEIRKKIRKLIKFYGLQIDAFPWKLHTYPFLYLFMH